MKTNMLIKFQLTIVLAVAFSLRTSQAQLPDTSGDFKVVVGEEFEIDEKHFNLGTFHTDKGSFVTISFEGGKNLTFRYSDNDLKYIRTATFDVSGMSPRFIDQGIRKIGNNWYWFYGFLDKEKDKDILFAQALDLDEGKFIGEAKKIIESNLLQGIGRVNPWNKIHFADKYGFRYSTDTNTLLIFCTLKSFVDEEVKKPDSIGLHVFDSFLQKKWNNDFAINYPESHFELSNFFVSTDGTVLITARILEEKRSETKDKRLAYHYEVLCYREGKQVHDVINLKNENRFLNYVHVSSARNDKIIFTGFYSNRPKTSQSEGIFLMELDKANLSVNAPYYFEFNDEIKKEFEKVLLERKAKGTHDRKEKEECNVALRGILFYEDGSILFAAEQRFHNYESDIGGTLAFNDLINVKINSDKTVSWMKRIPKRQVAGAQFPPAPSTVIGREKKTEFTHESVFYQNDLYSSSKAFYLKDNLYFIYDENEKNLNLPEGKTPLPQDLYVKPILVYSKLDSSGTATKRKILSFKDYKYYIRPLDCMLTNDGHIYTCLKDEEKYRLLKLELKE